MASDLELEQREKKILARADGIIFVDELQGRRAIFGPKELFDYICSNDSDTSVIVSYDIDQLPQEVINTLPKENWRVNFIEPTRSNKFSKRQMIISVNWHLLPKEFDVTHHNHPAQGRK